MYSHQSAGMQFFRTIGEISQVIFVSKVQNVHLTFIYCHFRMDSQVAFFCGSSPDCLTLGSDKALKIAIENIEKHYITVGVLEHLDISFIVMECLLPKYFSSISDLHRKIDLHMHNKHNETEILTQESSQKLREMLKNEMKLYIYVKRRLFDQYEKCKNAKQAKWRDYDR